MKLQKQNVIYRVEDPNKIQDLKNKGFKEVKPKTKLELKEKEENSNKQEEK